MFYDERGRHVIRIGDTTTHGGKVLTGDERMPIMGRPAARIGDVVYCPRCDSKDYVIVEGHEKMPVHGRNIAFEGDKTSCGAILISSLRGSGHIPSAGMASSLDVMDGVLTADASRHSSFSGGLVSGGKSAESLSHHRLFKLLDHNGLPLAGIPYNMSSTDSDAVLEGRTDASGMTENFETSSSEEVVFSIVTAGQTYEGARAKTVLYHNYHVTEVRVKIYWIHENLWDEGWIVKYRSMVESLAYALKDVDVFSPRGLNKATYTCEDFALSILVHFAYLNKLPIYLKTGAANFSNIDYQFNSRYKKSQNNRDGFLQDLKTVYGAPDTLKNCIQISRMSAQPGDLRLRNDHGHVQVVINNDGETIKIMQGNFPSSYAVGGYRRFSGGLEDRLMGSEYGANSAEGYFYLGVPVQEGVYKREGDGRWSYVSNASPQAQYTTWDDMGLSFKWNFEQCNQYF